MTQRAQWIVVGAVLVGLGGVLALGAAFASGIGVIKPGSNAPPFEAVDVTTGTVATLADYRGQVILLNVWATWCKPCEQEMPSMQRLFDTLGPAGLRVVAVSIDLDPPDEVRAWVQERGLTFDVLHDRRGRIQRIYQTTGVPESFVIDRHGVIVKKQIGSWEWDQPATVALFRRLLAADTEASSPVPAACLRVPCLGTRRLWTPSSDLGFRWRVLVAAGARCRQEGGSGTAARLPRSAVTPIADSLTHL